MRRTDKSILKQNLVYLLFWPVFVLRYLIIENFNPARSYHSVWCPLDDRIPFLEGFIIPYIFWYFCMTGVHLWLFLYDDPAYRKYSGYLMLTVTISTAIFLLYPTCQNLRLTEFPRKNQLTAVVRHLYRMDTNTNVCPSEHVIISFGFFLAVVYSEAATGKCRIIAGVTALMTAVATVFLKQHSVVDVIAAVPVCAVGWYAAFREEGRIIGE